MIRDLVAGGEAVYPLQLGELLRRGERRWPTDPDAVAHRPLQSIR